MYRRSNISITLSFMLLVSSKTFLCAVIRFFIHLVSYIVQSYNIYVNRLLFENEDSIIFCKQSVSSIWRDCKNRSTLPNAQSGNLLLENAKNSQVLAFSLRRRWLRDFFQPSKFQFPLKNSVHISRSATRKFCKAYLTFSRVRCTLFAKLALHYC